MFSNQLFTHKFRCFPINVHYYTQMFSNRLFILKFRCFPINCSFLNTDVSLSQSVAIATSWLSTPLLSWPNTPSYVWWASWAWFISIMKILVRMISHCSQFAWGPTFFKMGTRWGPKFQWNGDQMGTLASRMGTQKAHVCKIDGNKLIRWN